jgi:hypothetical protein
MYQLLQLCGSAEGCRAYCLRMMCSTFDYLEQQHQQAADVGPSTELLQVGAAYMRQLARWQPPAGTLLAAGPNRIQALGPQGKAAPYRAG